MARGAGRGSWDRGLRPRAGSRRPRRTRHSLAMAGNPPARPRPIPHRRVARWPRPPGCRRSRRTWRGSDPGALARLLCPYRRVRGVGPIAIGSAFRASALGPQGARARLAALRRWRPGPVRPSRRLSASRRARFRFRSLHSPLLAEDDRYPIQVEVLARPAGALLEGFDDSQAPVWPTVELEVCLELIYNPIAAALRRALRYHGTVVVAYPQRDRPFEGGPVAGYVGRVPHHVARCRMVDLDERSARVRIYVPRHLLPPCIPRKPQSCPFVL